MLKVVVEVLDIIQLPYLVVLVVVLQEIVIILLVGRVLLVPRALTPVPIIHHGVLQDMEILEVIRFRHRVMVLAVAAVPEEVDHHLEVQHLVDLEVLAGHSLLSLDQL
jgi:hypothetical protein